MAKTIEIAADPNLAAKSQIFIKCGDCLHYSSSRHPSMGELCKARGVTKGANAPICFTPNVHAVKWVSANAFAQLSSLISSLSASESRIFIGMFRQQARLARQGFSFLEQVYVKVGADYLANYFAAFALGVSPEGEILVVGSDFLNKQRNPVVMHMLPSSLIREAQFQQIKERLYASGRINPELPRQAKREVDAAYEPPTIETSVELLESLAKSTKKKRKNPAENNKPLEIDLSDL